MLTEAPPSISVSLLSAMMTGSVSGAAGAGSAGAAGAGSAGTAGAGSLGAAGAGSLGAAGAGSAGAAGAAEPIFLVIAPASLNMLQIQSASASVRSLATMQGALSTISIASLRAWPNSWFTTLMTATLFSPQLTSSTE